MEKFVDLGVSFFDGDFTLDPFPYLEPLYDQKDVLGFRADGMNFVFRFEQARQVIRSHHCRREQNASPEIEARERLYAERYPNRAKRFGLAFGNPAADGKPDFVTKKLIMDFLDETAEAADFSGAQPIFERLASGGRIDDYVDLVQTLPLRVLLDRCGLPATEDDLSDLQGAGFAILKTLDNDLDEGRLVTAEEGTARVWRYLDERLPDADPRSPIRELLETGRSLGIDDEKLRVNVGEFLVVALSNSAGVSSTFLLRTLIRFPEVRRALTENPSLVRDDNVITELLRRDNHVKSLGRQVHSDFDLGPFPMQSGESIHLFYPGVNLDPTHWALPLEIDLDRKFTGMNNVIFGGSAYMCIGKQLGLEFLKNMTAGFVEHLPDGARVVEEEVEADGDWVAERIITKMPIALDG